MGCGMLPHLGPTVSRLSRPIRTYIELAEQLRVTIKVGRLAPGDLLPTVPDLAGHCGLARSNLQRRLGLLAEEVVIVRTGTRWATAPAVPPSTDADEAATA